LGGKSKLDDTILGPRKMRSSGVVGVEPAEQPALPLSHWLAVAMWH